MLEDFLVDAKKGAVTYAVELVIIFSLTEIVPLVIGIHPKNIQALVEKPEDAANTSILPENRQSVRAAHTTITKLIITIRHR